MDAQFYKLAAVCIPERGWGRATRAIQQHGTRMRDDGGGAPPKAAECHSPLNHLPRTCVRDLSGGGRMAGYHRRKSVECHLAGYAKERPKWPRPVLCMPQEGGARQSSGVRAADSFLRRLPHLDCLLKLRPKGSVRNQVATETPSPVGSRLNDGTTPRACLARITMLTPFCNARSLADVRFPQDVSSSSDV